MRAAVYERYGPPGEVLEIREFAMPTVDEHDVLIRVVAASLNRSDWEIVVGSPFYARIGGLRSPKTPTPGTDVAGVIEAVGSAVKRFRPGDEVFGDLSRIHRPDLAGGRRGVGQPEGVARPDSEGVLPAPSG